MSLMQKTGAITFKVERSRCVLKLVGTVCIDDNPLSKLPVTFVAGVNTNGVGMVKDHVIQFLNNK
jgi:hypothetical protein